jgi:hypothetical protein
MFPVFQQAMSLITYCYEIVCSMTIDIKDGANACPRLSSSFRHKECPFGHSVGTGRLSAPRDDACKDIDFGFDSESDFC